MACPLCEAINDKYRLIYEDELVFCIITKCPLKKGHIMILPKQHIEKLSKLSEGESKRLFELIEKMKEIIEEVYNESAIVHINSGAHSTQKHIHIHILPSKGGLRPLISKFENLPEREEMTKKEMELVKEKIVISLSKYL
jgi:diadenosine tetraphosphate (Ap4A) HIT family hydrolase